MESEIGLRSRRLQVRILPGILDLRQIDVSLAQEIGTEKDPGLLTQTGAGRTFQLAHSPFPGFELEEFVMKFPKPWYRKGRGWFVTLDGQQIKLSSDRAEAFEKYRELISQPRKMVVAADSLAGIVDLFLDHVKRTKSIETFGWYRYRLERCVQQFPDYKVTDLTAHAVQKWVDSYGLSRSSTRNYLRAIKTCLRWADAEGMIRENPLQHMQIPSGEAKEVCYSHEEFDELLAKFQDDEFSDLLTVHWETGCRPQESLRVEARHVDVENSRWVFPKSEEKNKKRVRVVYLSEAALAITQRLMLKYPEGKLFRNSKGKPWTTDAVNNRFYRHQQKTGKRYSLYGMRHSWATHALRKGIDPLTVAILMGHNDPSMLTKVYQHLSLNPQHMLDQARKAVG